MDGLTLRVEDGTILSNDVLDRVARGEQVVVTRADQTVAHIVPAVPVPSEEQRASARAAFAKLAVLREEMRAAGQLYTQDELNKMRHDYSSDT